MIAREVSADPLQWAKFTEGAFADGDVDMDNDGEFSTNIEFMVDLSQALSQRLGRQMSMMSTYKVNYISVELRNQDDAADNEAGAFVSGKINYWGPTKHRIHAMQLARATERAQEETFIDADSFLLSADHDYKGMRFGWDGDLEVKHQTSEAFTGLAGSEWDLQELFTIVSSGEGLPQQTNALWDQGRCGYPNQMGWTSSITNAGNDIHSVPFVWDGGENYIEVLGGLLNFAISHCNVEHLAEQDDAVDDDYTIHVTLGIKGWSDF